MRQEKNIFKIFHEVFLARPNFILNIDSNKVAKVELFVAKYATMDKFTSMQTFIKVAQAGSFSAVANQMGVPRSLITRQIASLEKQLGVKLMTRSTRSLSLTTVGAAYLEKCRVILNLVDATESNLAFEQSSPKGLIRIGLPLSFGIEKLMPLLMEFAKQNPGIELAMDFSDRRSNLIEEGLDISIRITSNPESNDIVRKLGECSLLTVASPHYLELHGTPNKPTDLINHECLDYSMQLTFSNWSYIVDNELKSFPITGRIVANNGEALVLAATKSLGVTRQPDFIVERYLKLGQVVQILKKFKGPALGIYAVLPSNRYIPHRISVLMDFLSESI